MVRFHGILIGLAGVREGQIVQESLDRLTVRVVAPRGLAEAECQAIVDRCWERLGPISVNIELVESIERTDRGKFRAVLSKVPRAVARTTT
jgi:phenylacetate-coenzyme A ligase PaaK-like adenylate-forming protein